MFRLDFTSRVPIYEQLYNSVIQLASVGAIKPGDKLPPVRTIASQLGINPNTAAKAYRMLEAEGYIYSVVGKGSFLTEELSIGNAKRLMALESFRNATNEAMLYGYTRDELLQVIDEIIEGEAMNDSDK